jgi:hypothetical protein
MVIIQEHIELFYKVEVKGQGDRLIVPLYSINHTFRYSRYPG